MNRRINLWTQCISKSAGKKIWRLWYSSPMSRHFYTLGPSVLNLAVWRQLVFTRGNKTWSFFLIEFLWTTKHSSLCLQCYWLTVHICRCSSQHSQEKNKKNFAKAGFCTGCYLLNFFFSGLQSLYLLTVCISQGSPEKNNKENSDCSVFKITVLLRSGCQGLFFFGSEFCHTLKWNSHGFTCVPHPDPPSHLPLHPIPLGLPSAPAPSAYLMHPTWAGDLFHPR